MSNIVSRRKIESGIRTSNSGCDRRRHSVSQTSRQVFPCSLFTHSRHNSRLAGVINFGNSRPSIWRELRASRNISFHTMGPRRATGL